jgi:HEAT repeat protein
MDRQAGKIAIPALIGMLDAKEAAVRRQAARALGELGDQARDAVPSLRKALMDPDEVVRSEATAALKKMGP